METNEDLWYRIGYALEAAKHRLPASERSETRVPTPFNPASEKLLEAFFTVGAGTALTRLLQVWPGRGRPGVFRLARAGAAGAAAAFLSRMIRPALLGEELALEEELTEILLSGAGRGLLYAAIVEPRTPRPSILQGAIYGALEYALSPWGGLEELAGKSAPQSKLPVLAVLLQGRDEEDPFLAHVAFGVALALLYES